jgi:predicted amidohydrolase
MQRKGAALLKAWEEVCAGLASRFSVWLAPGSTVAPGLADGSLVAQAHLFAPDGHIASCQQQTRLGAREKAWGLVCGDNVQAFETPLGRIGLVVGEDQIGPTLAMQGANILIRLTALPAPFDETAWPASLWNQAQAHRVFGIEACLVGECFGQTYAGRSAIYAPVEMTEGRRGSLAQASTTEGEQVVIADLDFDAPHPLPSRLNKKPGHNATGL